jgi:flagellar biosynthesis activator protein FlaF
MHQIAYSHVVDDAPSSARERERRALNRSLELLERAETAGLRSREMFEALHFTTRLWSILLEDLGDEQNALPEELRASLISVGLWVLRTCEELRLEQSADVASLIEITRTIRDGLR